MSGRFRVRWPLWAALAAAVLWGGTSAWRRAQRETQILARTTCPFRGEPRVIVSADVSPADTQPVRIHEEVHAAQCRALGPVRYRWRNLFPGGKLALEAPAYCAAAQARLRAGMDSARVRERLGWDATEALRNVADSATVMEALRTSCPGIIAPRTNNPVFSGAVSV